MSISFDEVSLEVAPDRRRGERSSGEAREEPSAGPALDEKIRAAMAREQHRVERLSDQ